MSLWAMGSPVSGPPFPVASRWSAARASVSARSFNTVMKALSLELWRSMRARKVRVNSSLETFLDFRSRASSASVFLNIGIQVPMGASKRDAVHNLFNNLGHQVESGLHLGGVLLVAFSLHLVGDRVLPQPLGHVQGMGHGLDLGGVRLVQLGHEFQDAGQVLGVSRDIPLGNGEPREAGDGLHVVRCEGHGCSGEKLMGNQWIIA